MKTTTEKSIRIVQRLAVILFGLVGALWLFMGSWLLTEIDSELFHAALFYFPFGLTMVCIAYAALFKKRILRKFVAVFLALVFGFSVWVSLDPIRIHRLRLKATEIRKGDTLDRVVSIMGKPDLVYPKGRSLFSLFGGSGKSPYKEVVYGPVFEWDNAFSISPPFFFPFKFRLFGPSAYDDIDVYLDEDDQVVKVRIRGKLTIQKSR